MFNPISITFVNEEIHHFNWPEQILKLDNMFVFKFSVIKLISCNLSDQFSVFVKLCLKCLVLKVYSYLLEQETQEEVIQWNKQITSTSAKIKNNYCQIMRRLKKNKKSEVIDIVILIIALISRDFLQSIFIVSKKQGGKETEKRLQKYINDQHEENNKSMSGIQNCSQQPLLQVQQYAFIIITHETTGNIVNPSAFQYLKKKIIQRTIYRPQSSAELAQSLKYAKQQMSRKEVFIQRRRSVRHKSIQKFLKSALKIFEVVDHHEAKLDRRKDLASQSLHQILKKNKLQVPSCQDQDNLNVKHFDKLEKINERSLSKAFKFHYQIHQKDLSLLQRSKQRSESLNSSSHPPKYWRQVKSISKPTFQIKNKSISDQIVRQGKQEKKKWCEVISQLKRNFNRSQIEVQKFKSNSFSIRTNRKTGRTGRSQKEHNQQVDVQKKLGSLISQHSESNQSILYNRSSNSINQLIRKQTKLRKEVSLGAEKQNKKPYGNITQYKVNRLSQNYYGLQQQPVIDVNKLKKKIADIKKHKNAFEQKCKQRKTVLQTSNH